MSEGDAANSRDRTALPFLKSPLTRFVAAAVAWLPVTFGAWYLLAPILLWPVRLFVQLVARFGFGDLVRAIDAGGSALTFLTTLKPGEGVAAGVVSVDVNMLVYAFGMPLFAALTLPPRAPPCYRPLPPA